MCLIPFTFSAGGVRTASRDWYGKGTDGSCCIRDCQKAGFNGRQPRGGMFPDTAAVPLADGRIDNYTEEVRQDCGTSGIYRMILCKTEKFSGGPDAAANALSPMAGTVPAMVSRQYMPWSPCFLLGEGCSRNGSHKLP